MLRNSGPTVRAVGCLARDVVTGAAVGERVAVVADDHRLAVGHVIERQQVAVVDGRQRAGAVAGGRGGTRRRHCACLGGH